MIPTPTRDKLQAFEEQNRRERAKDLSLWRLIQSFHSHPALREAFSLDTVPLKPAVEIQEGGEAVAHILLARPVDGVLRAPFGHLAWGWPSKSLLAFSCLKPMPAGMVSISKDHRCTQDFADDVQKALAEGRQPPPAPAPIAELIRQQLGREVTIVELAEAPVVAPAPVIAPVVAPKPPPRQVAPLDAIDLQRTLDEARQLLKYLQAPDLDREWRLLQGRLGADRYSVVIAGNHGRGKSTLVNKLLKQDHLPTGLVDPRAAFIEILYSDRAFLRKPGTGGAKNAEPSPETLKEYLAGSGAEPGEIQLGLADSWLEADSFRLIEAPGPDRLDEKGVGRFAEVLAEADAVLVVVSATMALSLSEKNFVETQLLQRRVPRVAIVLTHLDLVKARERRDAVDFVRGKISAWGPDIPLCLPQESLLEPEGQTGLIVGANGIRLLLTNWARNGERQYLIHRQIRENLDHCLGLAQVLLGSRRQAAVITQEERQARASESRRRLESRRLDWEDLRLEMERRESSCSQWLEQELRDRARGVLDGLRYELSRQPDPKEWWERDLPQLLSRRLDDVQRGAQQALENHLTRDAKWLAGEVTSRFSRALAFPRQPGVVLLEKGSPPAPQGMSGVQHLRYYVRAGSLAAFVGFQYLSMGMPASGGALLAGEIFLKSRVEQQRKTLSQRLPGIIEGLLEKGITTASSGVRKIYAGMIERFRHEQEAWDRIEIQALAAGPVDGSLEELDRLLGQVDRLRKTLKIAERESC